MTDTRNGDDGEKNSKGAAWRDGEFSGGDGVEKQLREGADEDLHETMDKAFSEPVPRSSDPVQDKMERVAEGDTSAAKALLEDDGDDLEAVAKDAGPEELMKMLIKEVRANREAIEVLAEDESEKNSPWTI